MKKKYLIISFLFISSFGFSQMESYYDDIATDLTTLTGIPLKDVLATKIINTHTNFLDYTPEVWEACKITDEDPNNSSNVLLIYGWEDGSDGDITNDLSRSKGSNGGNNGDWNREHTFANSLADPDLDDSGRNGTPFSDAHNLRASDVQRNGFRGNLKFANGSENSGTSNGGWYPGDASTGGTDWRGDVARITMYMYLRYGSQCLPRYNSFGATNSVDADMVNLLLDWNAADPVSDYEDARNTYHESNGTYAQGNRNPFIDNPYLATLIWGGTPAEDRWGLFDTNQDVEPPTIPSNVIVSNETSTSVDLNWTVSTDNVGVTQYDIYYGGVFHSSSSTNSHTVTGLSPSTTYSFTIQAKDAASNYSAFSTPVNGTTLAGSSGGTDLFFSEYMEGSSSNKALEIANVTGNEIVDLSIYSVKLAANGNTDWSTATYNFPAISLANDDVFVIGNASLAVCTGVVDATSNVTFFGGNDVIGLFKNDVLIDILGTLGDTANFAQNTTLVRKPNINTPTTTFNINDWDSFDVDTCADLGSHTFTLSLEKNELIDVSIYPNPSIGNNITISSSENLDLIFYNILGKEVLKANTTSTNKSVDISILSTGIYFVKLENELGITTKKFIKK